MEEPTPPKTEEYIPVDPHFEDKLRAMKDGLLEMPKVTTTDFEN